MKIYEKIIKKNESKDFKKENNNSFIKENEKTEELKRELLIVYYSYLKSVS